MTVAPPKPPQDELEALIPEARARQLRRRLVGAASIAVAAGSALGIYAVSGGSHHARTAGSRVGGVPPLCRTSQISVSVPMLIGVIEEGRTGLFVMKNKSNAVCSLPLGPPRASITRHGARLPVRQVRGRGIVLSSWEPLRATRLLEPGGRAAISSYWQNWCGSHSDRLPLFTEHFRFDDQLSVSLPLGPHPYCSARGAPSTIRVSRPLLVRS